MNQTSQTKDGGQMRNRALLVAAILVLSLAICGVSAAAEELVNDTRKTAVAVRITFIGRVFITGHGREFDTVGPASGLSDVFVFSGGEVRRNGTFEVEWAPGLAIKSVEWLEVYDLEELQAEQDPVGVEIFLGFESSPEIGTWPSNPGWLFMLGTYFLSRPAEGIPHVGLIGELSHDSLCIETEAVGDGTGIVFGYQDTENYFALYQVLSVQGQTLLVLAEFSGRTTSPIELARKQLSSTQPIGAQGSSLAVVISEGHVECFFDERLVMSLDCVGIPTMAGAGLYFGIVGYGNNGIFEYLRISQTALDPTAKADLAL